MAFVNVDVISRRDWPGSELEHAYEASARAAVERQSLLDAGRSFATETVFSHHSKLELVRDAHRRGYLIHLHVLIVPVDLSVARVAERVLDGGHDVPEVKIRGRFDRLWDLVLEARSYTVRTTFYDNTRADRPFRVVAEFAGDSQLGDAAWPRWTPQQLRG